MNATELKAKLVCPKCNRPLIIYVDGLACSDIACGGLLQPMELRIKETLKSLRKMFPELCSISPSDNCGDARTAPPPSMRTRSASSKQLKSIQGQRPLIP